VVSGAASLAPFVIGLPLAGAALLLLFGRRIGRASGPIACSTIGAAFVLGVVTFFRLIATDEEGREATVRVFEWIAAGNFVVGAELLVDQLSIVMVLVVTGVGTLIHVYSIGYMHGDPLYPRYFGYLNLFAASMLVLVLADNVLLLYVGWEGVGLCSYLLIGFWFEREAAHNAAKKAFLVNRLGDFAFLLGIFLLSATVGSLTVAGINEAAGAMGAGAATTAALLLFAGATGKSAQIPLYVWLPDAMEGPTPVSALIHAATMVTAGVYVVARLGPVFEASGGPALAVVAWIGALTALWAALMASAEYDIKRVLAYSTISQLGYMFLANGVAAYSAGMFHLVTHAFFKALMFLGAGAVMHGLGGATDMRTMGGLRKVMPVTGSTFLIGWLAISGIFPLSGFFSKDAILASAWHEGQYALWAIGAATAVLTAFYMSRLYFRVFEGELRHPEGTHPHDAPASMAIPLVALAGLAVLGGAINLPGLVTLEHWLEPAVGPTTLPGGIVPWILGAIALAAAVAGIAGAGALYASSAGPRRRDALYIRLRPLVDAARHRFYVDEIYGRAFVLPGKAFAGFCANTLDAGVVDGLVNGVGRAVAGSAEGLRRLQTGYVRNYGVIFLLGVVVIFSILVLRVS
jgi:NADH-quinone oxidoreductase subunit L